MNVTVKILNKKKYKAKNKQLIGEDTTLYNKIVLNCMKNEITLGMES